MALCISWGIIAVGDVREDALLRDVVDERSVLHV
jgi:hypothetical protein